MPNAWMEIEALTEFQLNEKFILKEKAVLVLNDCKNIDGELHAILRACERQKRHMRFVWETSNRTWNTTECLVWYLVDHGRLVQVISEQCDVKALRGDRVGLYWYDGSVLHFESRGQIEIEVDWRHREIVLVKMELSGASTKSVVILPV